MEHDSKAHASSPLQSQSLTGVAPKASFSLANRLYRAVWALCWLVLARWTPRFLNPWRILVLRIFGADVAWSASVSSSARIWSPANLKMAPNAGIGDVVVCYNQGVIALGERATVSHFAHLVSGTHAIDDASFQLIVRPCFVGADAVVDSGAFVGPGVRIGDGAVLGPRAVATKDLHPWTLYVGNPARSVGDRRPTDRSSTD